MDLVNSFIENLVIMTYYLLILQIRPDGIRASAVFQIRMKNLFKNN